MCTILYVSNFEYIFFSQGMDTTVSPGHSSDYADQEDSFLQSPVCFAYAT